MSVCRFVGRSVARSVGRLVGRSVGHSLYHELRNNCLRGKVGTTVCSPSGTCLCISMRVGVCVHTGTGAIAHACAHTNAHCWWQHGEIDIQRLCASSARVDSADASVANLDPEATELHAQAVTIWHSSDSIRYRLRATGNRFDGCAELAHMRTCTRARAHTQAYLGEVMLDLLACAACISHTSWGHRMYVT